MAKKPLYSEKIYILRQELANGETVFYAEMTPEACLEAADEKTGVVIEYRRSGPPTEYETVVQPKA